MANNLIAVLSQTLCPRVDTEGMVAAYEFMYVTPGIQNLIRENKSFRIDSEIQTGKKYGMQLLDDNLWRHYSRPARSAPRKRSTRARIPARWSTDCTATGHGRQQDERWPPKRTTPKAAAAAGPKPKARPAAAAAGGGRAKPSGRPQIAANRARMQAAAGKK